MNRLTLTTRTKARPGRAGTGSTGRGIRAVRGPSSPPTGSRLLPTRRGFTLIELMVVIIILAILVALLLPAINSAVRTARNAAVQAEINQIAQALENFKSKYGDYPPSRVLLVENGNYSTYIGSPVSVNTVDSTAGAADITMGQLASRTVAAFRKFWPKVQLGTGGNPVPNISATYFYDFNGNGVLDNAYILHGHECLVFFLGGIATPDNPSNLATSTFGMSGFGKDPTNPFSNNIPNALAMYSANRDSPFFEFTSSRLYLDPSNPTTPGIPGYYDSLGNLAPTTATTGTGQVNFYAYFSAYGNGNYDPNDVNIFETDSTSGQGPIELHYNVTFPLTGQPSPPIALSPSPNPYTSTLTVSSTTGSGTVTYQKPQTYQIFSSGADGLYGVGGRYVPATSSNSQALPFDNINTYNGGTAAVETDSSVRQREHDNLTNFKQGTLE